MPLGSGSDVTWNLGLPVPVVCAGVACVCPKAPNPLALGVVEPNIVPKKINL